MQGNELAVIGCEFDTAGDIWLLERSLGNPNNLFPTPTPPPIWEAAETIDHGLKEMTHLQLLVDSNGRLHALWGLKADARIFYSLWDGTRWTKAHPVITSPGGEMAGLTAVMHPNGQLFVAWVDANSGESFFSLVPSAEAFDESKWLASQEIPLAEKAAAPQALVLPDGRITIVYAVPYNERRGIFLVESLAEPEAGQTLAWSTPEMAFDGAAAGWDSLSDPRLALDGAGGRHLLWTRYSLPPDARASGLYASHSIEVEAWSDGEAVIEDPILWSEVLAAPDGSLHRAWQESPGGQAALYHQFSRDNGVSWSQPKRLSGAINSQAAADLAVDSNGNLNLLLLGESNRPGEGVRTNLQRWEWNGDDWQAAEQVTLDDLLDPSGVSLASPPDRLDALISGQVAAISNETSAGTPQPISQEMYGLFTTGRSIEGLPKTQVSVPTATAQIMDEITPTPTPTQPLQPTATFRVQPDSGSPIGFGGPSSILIFGAIPAVLLVVLVFFFLIRFRR